MGFCELSVGGLGANGGFGEGMGMVGGHCGEGLLAGVKVFSASWWCAGKKRWD